MKHLDDMDVSGKRVLLRVDVNVPLGSDGRVDPDEDWRIVAIVPTVRYLLEHGARVVLIGHLGRPNGTYKGELTLKPVGEYLERLMSGQEIAFADPWRTDDVMLPPKAVTLLENVRFDPGEEANAPDFAAKLASFGDVFVNDAFADSHRAHASIVGIAPLKPHAAGLLMEREVQTLTKVLKSTPRPLVVIVGGAKPGTKLPLMDSYLRLADHVLVGGVLANVFLAFKGLTTGRSVFEEEDRGAMEAHLKNCDITNTRLHLPVDALVSSQADGSGPVRMAAVGNVPHDQFIFDIGPDTLELFANIIRKAGTVIWNGPMGYYEIPAFRKGTETIAAMIARAPAFSVVGGGDSVVSLKRLGLIEKIDHVSTGGGAMLEFLAGVPLPGIAALE
ncbi:MAG: phosphoglycerate kinase [bacterium]|nr:phosphoglycerate kinase [bacterium]MDZ4296589.1 phosphoglycerate kinase [Patescibacteria group bacterium]